MCKEKKDNNYNSNIDKINSTREVNSTREDLEEEAEFLGLSGSGTCSPVCPRLVATGVKTGTVVERLLSIDDVLSVEVTVGLGLLIGEEEEEREEGGVGLVDDVMVVVVVMMLVD